jgi:hypothetical protein
VASAQQVRLSQFVISYGPGAILEGVYGPRVIPRPDLGLFLYGSDLRPEDFEVSDQRMSHGLLSGARIFRLPSNAELGHAASWYIYRTRAFPSWILCLNASGHGGPFAVLYQGRSCPVCSAAARGRTEAIRFLVACPAGHMDDVYWHAVVHGRASCTGAGWFRWYGLGGSLGDIRIECPECGQVINLGRAYSLDWPCSGRFPEREALGLPPQRPANCSHRSRIIQRQSSNLRIAELRTLFTVPGRHTALHVLLGSTPIRAALAVMGPDSVTSLGDLERLLDRLREQRLVTSATISEITCHPWQEIRSALRDMLAPVATGLQDLLLEEFYGLIEGSVHGIPPRRTPRPTSPVVLEVNPEDVRTVPGPAGRLLRVTPVSRLRTVTVQVGYRRALGADPGSVVDVSFCHEGGGARWYPGVEFLGEGIFIILDDSEGWHFGLSGSAVDYWQAALDNPTVYSEHLFRMPQGDRLELHPAFVWWHTFAHSLIRAISVEAGYSSASVRERVYIQVEGANARGGVVLYATQPGADGTLGGLIALVPHFRHILNTALDILHSCSNDPLCIDSHFRPGQVNGPACYGCVLLSETSCEHRNLWLDREVFLQNLP